MCGRFYVDERTVETVLSLAEVTDADFPSGSIRKDGRGSMDIHPAEKAAVLYGREGRLHAGSMRWGFPAFRSGGLLINARAETALQKPSFSQSVLKRRCVIPAAGFYEWDADRNKVSFFLPEPGSLFLAGFYNLFEGEQRYVILTTRANESMRDVHDRMPLILPREDVSGWIHEPDRTGEYLERESALLSSGREYEQLKLPL